MLQRTAYDVLLEERKANAHVKTSCQFFDERLRGGFKTKTVTELVGNCGSGNSFGPISSDKLLIIGSFIARQVSDLFSSLY